MKILPISRTNNYNTNKTDQLRTNYSQPNYFSSINFRAVKLLSVSPKFKPIEKDILNETKNFVEKKKGANFLGAGVFSEVFELLNLNGIVLKRSFRNDDFKKEQEAMEAIPQALSKSQQFVARAWDDETYKYYILSTKVKGSAPEPDDNPWTDIHLKNLFDGFLEMDKIGLYHGDLNNGNILLEKNGNVNFIDFQWSTKTNSIHFFENNTNQNLPNFIPIQNSQMFEMAEIPYYLLKMGNAAGGKKFLKEYLQAKSQYHSARVNYIKNLTENWTFQSEIPYIEKACRFEDAQAKMYQNPDENTLRLEAKKIQFLSSFREAYKYLDPNTVSKNILTAPSSYLIALSNLQSLRREIAEQKKKALVNSYNYDYLDGTSGFAEYWYKDFNKWTEDAFYYPYRHARNDLLDWESIHNFNDPDINIEHFDSMSNILKNIDETYILQYNDVPYIKTYTSDFLMKEVSSQIKMKNLNQNLNQDNYNIYNKLIHAYNNLKKSYDAYQGLNVINWGLLLSRRAEEMRKAVHSNYLSYSLSSQYYNLNRSASDLSKAVFKTMFNEIKTHGPGYYTFPGYKDMNVFL